MKTHSPEPVLLHPERKLSGQVVGLDAVAERIGVDVGIRLLRLISAYFDSSKSSVQRSKSNKAFPSEGSFK